MFAEGHRDMLREAVKAAIGSLDASDVGAALDTLARALMQVSR